MIWLKLILLWWLSSDKHIDFNTIMMFINNLISLSVSGFVACDTSRTCVSSAKMVSEIDSPRAFSAAFILHMLSWKAVVSTILVSKLFNSDWLKEIPAWDVPALPAIWLIVFGVLETEVSRYKQSCIEDDLELYAEKDVRALRCICLWASWIFPLNLACTVFVPGMTSALWQGLFRGVKGSLLPLAVSLFSLISWLSTVIMVTSSRIPRPKQTSHESEEFQPLLVATDLESVFEAPLSAETDCTAAAR